MIKAIQAFLRDRRGAVAISFVALLPVMVSGMALAIDYSNYRLAQTRMQTAVDSGALSAVAIANTTAASMKLNAVNIVSQNVPADYGSVTTAADVTVGTYTTLGGFVPSTAPGANAVRVIAERSTARRNAAARIFSVFLSDDALTIRATAIAARPNNVWYEPPEITTLDSDAYDFNELYAYCYDPSKPVAQRRGEMKLISNNIRPGVTLALFPSNPRGSSQNLQQPNTANWPTCSGAGQSVSFRLRNFINANQTRNVLWTTTENNYYSDTLLTNGVESSAMFGPSKQVETKRCDTSDKCNPSKANSDIATGPNRTANLETRPCAPGKFMYYGFEDRPPANGGSDKDYNDITVRLRCPASGQLGDGKPRLVG